MFHFILLLSVSVWEILPGWVSETNWEDRGDHRQRRQPMSWDFLVFTDQLSIGQPCFHFLRWSSFLIIGQKSWINGMQWSDWSTVEHGWDSHLTVMVDHRWYLYRLPLPWWELALFLVSFLLFSRNRSATTGLTILKVVFTVFCFTWTLEKVEVRPAIISYIFSPSLLVVIIHSL